MILSPLGNAGMHMDLDEGRYARLSCLSCKGESAEVTLAHPVRCFVVALSCRECGTELCEFDQFTERAA